MVCFFFLWQREMAKRQGYQTLNLLERRLSDSGLRKPGLNLTMRTDFKPRLIGEVDTEEEVQAITKLAKEVSSEIRLSVTVKQASSENK